MAPSPPTPDNNPALARYIAKRQDKAGATVPSSLPSNHTNRPSNRTTQIVNPKNRFPWIVLAPFAAGHHSFNIVAIYPTRDIYVAIRASMMINTRTAEKLAISNKRRGLMSNSSVCSRAWIDRTISHRLLPAPTSTITCKKLYKLLRELNYVKTLMRKDKAHTSHSMDLPMELRYMIPHLALQFDTENPCRPAD
ncbi:hypothetical protein D6D27_08631 [Aureobasidium pullulans]|nr:hypothetical protein D6D27_08631 [Aureobasidium pullulans]TIA80794.1 hypothetical protein D6C76_03029 [Aureobasidium pullulans]